MSSSIFVFMFASSIVTLLLVALNDPMFPLWLADLLMDLDAAMVCVKLIRHLPGVVPSSCDDAEDTTVIKEEDLPAMHFQLMMQKRAVKAKEEDLLPMMHKMAVEVNCWESCLRPVKWMRSAAATS
ncbi:hypothetical protein V8B97DRAFT_1920852 [Scleroderma yunnanense]